MKYNGKNLKKVLDTHIRWLNGEKGWLEKYRADLSEADLRKADLRNVDLREANLRETHLGGAYLEGACLKGAHMRGADLAVANLKGADLSNVDLSNVNLRCADLREANLSYAYLRGADLIGADIEGACLLNADLRGAKHVPFIPMSCPDTGSFIGWKKCRDKKDNNVIVKLLIPEDAKRLSSTNMKCRCDRAVVLEIQNLDGSKADFNTAYSMLYSDQNFAYKVGKTVVPEEPFEEDRWEECASGIHFFINRQEAVDY
jgi:uncharacterized protein YjbI with pentapeptide repeats